MLKHLPYLFLLIISCSALDGENLSENRSKREITITITGDSHRSPWTGNGGSGGGGVGGNGRSVSSNAIRGIQKLASQQKSLAVPGSALRTSTPSFAVGGVGAMTLSKGVSGSMVTSIEAIIAALARLAAQAPVGFLLASFWPCTVGDATLTGSGALLPSRASENFYSLSIPTNSIKSMPGEVELLQAVKSSGKINAQVRGVITADNEKVNFNLVKLSTPQPLKVARPVFDKDTTMYVHELPGGVGKSVISPPSITGKASVLINPVADVKVTVTPPLNGKSSSRPTTPFPIYGNPSDQDVILVFPIDSRIKPIYVMYNKPRKGVRPEGHRYHPSPKTEDISKDIGDLIDVKPKNKVQGGGGLRKRWTDKKGKYIFEWDSQEAELEKYRASDREHLGSFDHKTGKQKKGAKSGRRLREKRSTVNEYSKQYVSVMGLKLRLEWFDKSTEAIVGKEYSRYLEDNGTVVEELGLTIENNINNGGFEVKNDWIGILKPYFKHNIDLKAFDYIISFDYRDEWPEDTQTISWNLNNQPFWKDDNYVSNYHIKLTPNVSGKILRASYEFRGKWPKMSAIDVKLLNTSFLTFFKKYEKISFSPRIKQVIKNNVIEVIHSERNCQGQRIGRPLDLIIELVIF